MTATIVPTSERGRTLLVGGALNGVLREAAEFAGRAWIATYLPRRFQASYAAQLGYVTSQRVDPWHAKEPGRWPATYGDRKREWMGHADSLVWTGRLRSEIYRWANAKAVATKGQARGAISFGRLNVGSASRGFRQLSAAHPAGRIVLGTLTAFPAAEQEFVRDQATAYLAERYQALSAPVKTAARLPAPPAILGDGLRRSISQHVDAQRSSDSAYASIGARMRDRVLARKAKHAAWKSDAGGSSPLSQRAMTPAERRARHVLQARASYARRRAIINARRRHGRRLASAIRQLTKP